MLPMLQNVADDAAGMAKLVDAGDSKSPEVFPRVGSNPTPGTSAQWCLHGPYERKDGRKYVIWRHRKSRARKNQLLSRYLLEQHLGRYLRSDEHVDHINEDRTDDRIENLQLLSRAENARKSAALRRKT